MTKQYAIEAARSSRSYYRMTFYVIRKGSQFNIVPSSSYRRNVHGVVVAILGAA